MTQLEKRLTDLGFRGRVPLYKLLLPFTLMSGCFFVVTFFLIKYGIGIWGVNIPVAWGFAIVSFVWWIGIGHAGTFISAILLLLRQDWRNSINRIAESMTLLAVACAGLYPILHLGKPWYFFWLLPYPNQWDLYPQYRSPLVWDAFAVSTYALISIIFWYVGMIPDLAIARENSTSKFKQILFSILSLGWSGELKEWATFKKLTYILALLATPLVISVHSIVALDFSVAKLPGWHSPFFPPYFVAGAIYSGFAMVLIILIYIRRKFSVEELITSEHLDKCAKFLLMSGSFVTYCYLIEFFTIWYGQEHFELKGLHHEAFGPKAMIFWLMLFFNSVILHVLWFPKLRKKTWILLLVSGCVLVGMWMERYVIIVTTLSDTFLPAMKGHFTGTKWDWMLLIGSIGIFGTGLTIIFRFLPFIPITEIKEEKKE